MPTSTSHASALSGNVYLNPVDLAARREEWVAARPFSHVVIDHFLQDGIIRGVDAEFPSYDGDGWYSYDNPLEVKKALNNYDKFGGTTYRLVQFLYSPAVVAALGALAGCELFPDIGLNGGGLHAHRRGGRLNPHLDYSLHPKLGLQRKINLIVYLTPEWDPAWGGALGLWAHDAEKNAPGLLTARVDCLFNRALLFDTSQNSWHGLPEPITCPPEAQRRSLALYYLCEPGRDTPARGRALYAPDKTQENDPEVRALIDKRASVTLAPDVYRK